MEDKESRIKLSKKEIEEWVIKFKNDPYLNGIKNKMQNIIERHVPLNLYNDQLKSIGAIPSTQAEIMIVNLKEEMSFYVEKTYPKELFGNVNFFNL